MHFKFIIWIFVAEATNICSPFLPGIQFHYISGPHLQLVTGGWVNNSFPMETECKWYEPLSGLTHFTSHVYFVLFLPPSWRQMTWMLAPQDERILGPHGPSGGKSHPNDLKTHCNYNFSVLILKYLGVFTAA